MATTLKLQAQARTATGKGAARSLRRQGLVPAVVYGHGEETRACAVEFKQLEKLLSSAAFENTLIDLKLEDGKTSQVLIREVQVHPYRPELLHVDFLAVRKGEKVKLDVPIRLVGLSPGVKEGGIMERLRHEVEIRCVPSAIPEVLEVDVSALSIGDSVTVADLTAPAGVEILSDLESAIATVVPPTVHKEEVPEEVAAEEEEAAEPELVGRGKAEEEEATAEEE
jgi:large subunit ribosomal protein L25